MMTSILISVWMTRQLKWYLTFSFFGFFSLPKSKKNIYFDRLFVFLDTNLLLLFSLLSKGNFKTVQLRKWTLRVFARSRGLEYKPLKFERQKKLLVMLGNKPHRPHRSSKSVVRNVCTYFKWILGDWIGGTTNSVLWPCSPNWVKCLKTLITEKGH